MPNNNRVLHRAKKRQLDEFYTRIEDIEKELKHYKAHFENKIVFCNCDDPERSDFFKYFYLNFDHLGLKKLITTHYEREKPSYKLEVVKNSKGIIKPIHIPLHQNGDFRSPEAIEALEESDIVCTNPPFSLFREYVDQLSSNNKKFLIIGNQNAITYKEIFALIKMNKIWSGYHFGNMEFKVPDYYEPQKTRFWIDKEGQKWRSLGNITWFTNLDIKKRHEELILYKKYNPEEYPKYDNYDVINVDKVADIPCDYEGVMGVPITFLDKYNPEQFEILGIANSARWIGYECFTLISNRKIYNRILIKRKLH